MRGVPRLQYLHASYIAIGIKDGAAYVLKSQYGVLFKAQSSIRLPDYDELHFLMVPGGGEKPYWKVLNHAPEDVVEM
jgi:putative intracellular protease/amidase